MKFAICYNSKMDGAEQARAALEKALECESVDILDIDELKSGYDFAFVIGGDGTILKAARFYACYHTPIFGINLGRLGFLSQARPDRSVEFVQKILQGKYKIQDRIMLKSDGAAGAAGSFADAAAGVSAANSFAGAAAGVSAANSFAGGNTALNDFVIKGSAAGRTSRFSLKINGKAVCDYLADGIIVATPTGSTAYGLSAGGPVLTPDLNAFVIVPIAAHTLSARPLVVPDTEKITVCAGASRSERSERLCAGCAGAKYLVSADGQEFCEFTSEITIEKSPYSAKLALPEGHEFYSTLRDKLHWGISPAQRC